MTDNRIDRCCACGHYKEPRAACGNPSCVLGRYQAREEARIEGLR